MNLVIDGILNVEGGYTNNKNDKGGATNWGITEQTARAAGYRGDMHDLTRAEAYDILEKQYWTAPGFDRVSALSLALSFEMCDAAVNMGATTAIKWLQRWLNVFNQQGKRYPDITVDGKIGPQTLDALSAFLAWRGKEGEDVLLQALNCSQGEYYLSITERREMNEEFIYGWLKNRTSRID